MSEAEPSKPLLEDELVKSDGHGGQELELLPLPTEFDPSANFGDLIEVVAAEEDREAFERATRDRLDLPAVSLVIAEAPSRIESTGEQDQGATKRDEEPQRDGKDGDDPTLREILQSLARTQGADEGKRQEPQTGRWTCNIHFGLLLILRPCLAFSSPISDLPDLPTELPPSPEVRTVTLPPAQFSQSQSAATRPNGSAHPAESSATATRRAATEVDPAGGKTSGRAKRKSKAPASYFEHWADLEELNELGDIKAEGKSMSSKGGKNKKLKGLDGQPIKRMWRSVLVEA